MEHPARKITQIAREAEHIVFLAMRQDEIGTAEIDCIHALRHHPGITQTELAGMLHADKFSLFCRRIFIRTACRHSRQAVFVYREAGMKHARLFSNKNIPA